MIFLGREIGEQRNYSDDVAKLIDEEVRALIEHGYARPLQSFDREQDEVAGSGDKRIAEETVEAEEFEKLFSDLPPRRICTASAAAGRGKLDVSATRRQAGCPQRLLRASSPSPSWRGIPPTQKPGVRNGARLLFARRSSSGEAGYNRGISLPHAAAAAARRFPMADAPTHAVVRDDAIEQYLDRTADRRLGGLQGLPAHTEHSPASCPRQGLPRGGRFIATEPARPSAWSTSTSPRPAGTPSVYADWLHAAGKPRSSSTRTTTSSRSTPVELWDSPPFEPVVKQGRIWLAALPTNKAHVQIARSRHRGASGDPHSLPVNLKVIVEGRRNSSSIHLDAWLEANRERLAADFRVISDTSFFEGNLPAITIALRGLVYLQLDVTGQAAWTCIRVYTAEPSTTRPTPCARLCRPQGADGRVKVPGFYDDVPS